MSNIQTNSLIQFGSTFQTKTLTCLITDKKFLDQIYDIIDKKFYDSDSQKWIVEKILEYYSKYRKPPTLDVFKAEFDRKLINDTMKQAIVNDIRNIVKYQSANDLDYVKDNFLEFAKNQEMKEAIMDSVDLVNKGEYDLIRVRIDKAMKAGQQKNLGVFWKDKAGFDQRMTETLRSVIETPWDMINQITEGGLGKGELGIIISIASGGKSWMLVSLARHAAYRGKKVIVYTLELSQEYVALRHDANHTGYPSQDIKFHQDEVYHEISKVHGDILIKFYPTKSASVETLRTHISRCISNNFKPDMIIVDYADLLRGNIIYSKSEKRFELENIYEDLRGLAGELEIPIWTASQSNRDSAEEEIIEGNKVAESFNKIMIADFIMSLQRKRKDRLAHTGRVHIIKNRFGPDGFTFPSKMNAANGQLQMFEEKSEDGKSAKRESDKGDILAKRELNAKIDDILSSVSKKVDDMG